MRHHEIYGIDLRLPQLIVSRQVSSRIEGGKARLMIIPLRPQPSACVATVDQNEFTSVSNSELLGAARLALGMGLLQPPIALGHAFELTNEFVPEKYHKVGTGIVEKIDITRLDDVTEEHWRQCGYSSREDFNRYWHQATTGLGGNQNPWCLLIKFIFKG
ncbi:hypothetical protein HZF02_32945 (plasmid) [Pseudomonas yamanorum]|nr:hypothetical protein HZF02_32945 [Pseudomonas yamanorum]